MDDKTHSSWLEVSLVVDGEMAEAVAEVISRFAPNGVVIESTNIAFPADDDFDSDGEGKVSGPLRVYGYVPIPEDGLQAVEGTQRKLQEALWYLHVIRPLPVPEFKIIHETNWCESWKHYFHPINIGKRVIIIPAWLDEPAGERIPIRIDPGMAFGTGTHPTTQLCLELIEMILDQSLPAGKSFSMIDVGCGSGILSIAALKLGADRVLGVDTDAGVIPVTFQNAALNGIKHGLEAGSGSLAEILQGKFPLNKAPLVVANILAPVIIKLLDEGLADLIQGDGWLVLSGILEEQLEIEGRGVLPALKRNGLQVAEKRQINDWVALGVRRI